MKSTRLYFSLLLMFFIFSCSETQIINEEDITAKNPQFAKIDNYGNTVSNFAQELGITNFSTLVNTSNRKEIKISAFEKNINGFLVNLNSATVKISTNQGNSITSIQVILDNSKTIINFKLFDKDKSIIDEETKEKISKQFLKEKDKVRLYIALVIYNELYNPYLEKTGFVNNTLSFRVKKSCEMTIMGIDYTKSSSVELCNNASNEFIKAHPDCKKMYSVDSGCLWGDYGCVSTQAITCTGGGCDVPYGFL